MLHLSIHKRHRKAHKNCVELDKIPISLEIIGKFLLIYKLNVSSFLATSSLMSFFTLEAKEYTPAKVFWKKIKINNHINVMFFLIYI